MSHDVIGDIIEREGKDVATNDPNDAGKRTQYGISERSNPEAWLDGKVTEEEARAIYERKYVEGPGFHRINDPELRAQLIDFGVNSGPGIAIQKLQKALGVTQDGVIGPETLSALHAAVIEKVHNAVAVERVLMIGRIVQKNPSQLKFLVGWLNRATEFIK